MTASAFPYFNPPSPCGEGLKCLFDKCENRNFNPPSPCGEGRPEFVVCGIVVRFQSTLPVRGGTASVNWHGQTSEISIHPPRAGRDYILYHHKSCKHLFQSTLPVRGGTASSCGVYLQERISIHPPRAGRDRTRWRSYTAPDYFNPPSPCGEGHLRKII